MEKRETKISFAFFSLPSTFYGRKWDFSSSVFSYFYYFSALLSDPLFPSGKEKEKKYKAFFSFRKIVNSRQIPPVKERDLLLLVPLPPSFVFPSENYKKVQREKMEKGKKKFLFRCKLEGKSRSWSSFEHKGRRRRQKTNPWGISNEIRKKKKMSFCVPLV